MPCRVSFQVSWGNNETSHINLGIMELHTVKLGKGNRRIQNLQNARKNASLEASSQLIVYELLIFPTFSLKIHK